MLAPSWLHPAGAAGGRRHHRAPGRIRRAALFRPYRLDTGRYPTTELGLGALVNRPANEPKWNGPYLRKDVPLDPWGKAYVYKQPGERSDYDILSFGKDGQPGGTGENADITNH